MTEGRATDRGLRTGRGGCLLAKRTILSRPVLQLNPRRVGGGEGGERAQVSETAMLAFSIVFPESSDKDGLYCHIAEYYSAVRVVKSLRHYTRREIFPTGISRSITGYNNRADAGSSLSSLSLSLSLFSLFFCVIKEIRECSGNTRYIGCFSRVHVGLTTY
jgi:hypothetical protein